MDHFRVYTPRENRSSQDDLDLTSARSVSARGTSLAEYTEDFEPDSVSNTLNTPQYSDDFESVSHRTRSYGRITKNPTRYSGELETIKTSIAETIPEETALSVDEDTAGVTADRTSRFTTQYSYDFEDDSAAPTSGRTSRLTWQYSEDFDNTDQALDITSRSTESFSTRVQADSVMSSELSETTSTDQQTWADSSELSEGTSEATYLAEHNFVLKAIERMKRGATGTPGSSDKRVPVRRDRAVAQPEDKLFSKERKKFCKKMIAAIQAKQEPDRARDRSHRLAADNVKLRLRGVEPEDCVEHHGISHQAINRLRLLNTQANLNKIAKEPVHEPHKCPNCICALEKVAHTEFIRQRLHRAEEKRIRDQLDVPTDLATTLMTEPVVLPGHIQTQLSKLAPADIWNRLGHPHQEGSEGTGYTTPHYVLQDTPRSTSQTTPRSTSQDTPRSTPQGTSRSTSQTTPRSTSQGTSRSTPQDTPRSTSQGTPRSTSQGTPEVDTMITGMDRLQMCPHMKSHMKPQMKSHKTSVPPQDSLNADIDQYIHDTQQYVKQIKRDLHDEATRLHALDHNEFWDVYFSRLKQPVPQA